MKKSTYFHLETPVLLAAISYIVLGFMVMLPINVGTLDPNNKPYKFGYRLSLLLLMLIPIFISLYSINCMIHGKCVIWSYFNSLFICGWVFVFIISALFYNNNKT